MRATTTSDYWLEVRDADFAVPDDRPLDELTAELTGMLGSPDPVARDHTAFAVLGTWIDRGVYDDLLAGLGDGMAAGLVVGLGERGSQSVYRRSFSALILACCVERDNLVERLPASTVLAWGDRIASWYVREQDVRGYVEGEGWAHAISHGADAVGVLAESRHLDVPELTVLLDVLADRLMLTSGTVLTAGEPDRMAAATMSVLRRGLVPLSVVTPWLARVRELAIRPVLDDADPYPRSANPEAFLRALYVQLALTTDAPPERHDLVLEVADALRVTNRAYLAPNETEVTD